MEHSFKWCVFKKKRNSLYVFNNYATHSISNEYCSIHKAYFPYHSIYLYLQYYFKVQVILEYTCKLYIISKVTNCSLEPTCKNHTKRLFTNIVNILLMIYKLILSLKRLKNQTSGNAIANNHLWMPSAINDNHDRYNTVQFVNN